MADTRHFLGVDGDWNNTANWTAGDVPDAGDTVIIATSDKNITTNMDQSAIGTLTIHVLEGFTGTLGTPSSPLKLGATTLITMNAPRCGSVNVWPVSCTAAIIHNTMNTAYGFHLVDGAITTVHAVSGGGIRLGASGIVTALNVHRQGAVVHIEDGCGLTTANNYFGTVQSYENTTTTINQYGGTWNHLGDVAGTLAALNISGGVFYLSSPNATVTMINGHGGLVDASQDGGIKTITNCTARTGCTLNLYNGGSLVLTNAPLKEGGRIITDQTVTNTIPDMVPGAGVGP